MTDRTCVLGRCTWQDACEIMGACRELVLAAGRTRRAPPARPPREEPQGVAGEGEA